MVQELGAFDLQAFFGKASRFASRTRKITLVILGVVTSQMFLVFSSQRRVYMSTDRALEVQESARLITDLISQDVRMAGFMVPRYAAVASVDGGAADSDRLCISESGYFSTPVTRSSPNNRPTSPIHVDSVCR